TNNNLTGISDALSHHVGLSYGDSSNPTRPTSIAPTYSGTPAPGVSLTYGNSPTTNNGQLTRLHSPNGTTQTNTLDRGFLTHATFGRGTPAGSSGTNNLQDAFFNRSKTGEPLGSSPLSFQGSSGCDGSISFSADLTGAVAETGTITSGHS